MLRLCEACPRLYPSILPYLWRSLEIITRKDDKDAPIIDRGQAHHLQESAGLLNRLRYIREVNVKYAYDIPVELFCHAVGPWREDHHNRILWRRFKLPTKSRGSLLEVLQVSNINCHVSLWLESFPSQTMNQTCRMTHLSRTVSIEIVMTNLSPDGHLAQKLSTWDSSNDCFKLGSYTLHSKGHPFAPRLSST